MEEHLSRTEHELILRDDGTCSIRTIMNLPPNGATDYRAYESGCRWRTGHDDGHQVLRLELIPKPTREAPYYYFAEQEDRLLLWQYATDPDAWRYMEFEKSGA